MLLSNLSVVLYFFSGTISMRYLNGVYIGRSYRFQHNTQCSYLGYFGLTYVEQNKVLICIATTIIFFCDKTSF